MYSGKSLPPELRDGQYRTWEVEMAMRFALALSEMRWPPRRSTRSTRVRSPAGGIEIQAGGRLIMERLLARLEAEIVAQPVEQRDRFRIVQANEKLGRLTVYLADSATRDIDAAIQEASEQSIRTCEVCGAPGELAARGPTGWMSPRCREHETWSRFDRGA